MDLDLDLVAKARIWRDRPPSGSYIMHRIPRDWWCAKHGQVSKWHECALDQPAEKRPRIIRRTSTFSTSC